MKKNQAVSFHGANWTNIVEAADVAVVPAHVTKVEEYEPSSLRKKLITRVNVPLLFAKDRVYVQVSILLA